MNTTEAQEMIRASIGTADVLDARMPSAGDRLDSWKEIATYLRRSVRCVQRWEKNEGLPILRHRHARSATVYAYRGELDEWWHGRGESDDPESQLMGIARTGTTTIEESHIIGVRRVDAEEGRSPAG
jgi:hypothetical protein